MIHRLPLTFLACIVAFAVFASQVILVAAPGFGLLKKKTINLQVRRPAVVRLANTSIAVKGKTVDAGARLVLPILQTSFETELVSNERSLLKKPEAEAEWIVELAITGYSAPAMQRRVQTAKNVPATTFNRWTGSLNVAYQVFDKSGRVHDADNVRDEYDREFQAGNQQGSGGGLTIPGLAKVPIIGQAQAPSGEPRSAEELQQTLVKNVVSRIAAQLGNTVEPIQVQLAVGDDNLDRVATFMEQRLWNRAVEELEKAPTYAKLEDESYRQYSLGLAYEAMSYDSPAFAAQRANLLKAQEHYDKAAELNAGQRYFVEVIARTRESVARYRTLDSMQRGDQVKAGGSTAAPATAPAAAAPTAAKAAAAALTVNDVIDMRSAGVPDDQIVELIRASPVTFALDKDTLMAVAKSKMPVRIQNELRAKAGLPPLPATPAK
jgi:hypothetical protein